MRSIRKPVWSYGGKRRKGVGEEAKEGTQAGEDRKTYDFHVHSVANKQRNGLVCFHRIAVPAELRVIQIGSRNDSRIASQNDNNPDKS